MSMNNHELLQEIYYQNKSLNRTAQRISLIGLLGKNCKRLCRKRRRDREKSGEIFICADSGKSDTFRD